MAFDLFFVPSSEVTEQLISRIGERRAATLRQAAANRSGETIDPAETDDIRLALIETLENRTQDDWEDRRWLSDIIYHFMGRLARRSQRGGPAAFILTSCLVEGMGVRLGLKEPEDAVLLRDLADEFREWLRDREENGYVAGWGIMEGDPYDPEGLYFKSLTEKSRTYENGAISRPASAGMAVAAHVDSEPELADY